MGREEGLKTCAKVSLDHGERGGAKSAVTCSLSTVTWSRQQGHWLPWYSLWASQLDSHDSCHFTAPGPLSLCPYSPEQCSTRQGLQEHAPVRSCPVRHLLGDALTPPGSFPFGATFPIFQIFSWVYGKWGLIYIFIMEKQ